MPETLLPIPDEVKKVYSNPENYPGTCTRIDSPPLIDALAKRAIVGHNGHLMTGPKEKIAQGIVLLDQVLKLANNTNDQAVIIGSTPRHLGDPMWNHDIDIQLQSLNNITNGLSPYPLTPNISSSFPRNRSLYELIASYALLTRHSPENPQQIYSAAIIHMPSNNTDPVGRDHIVEFGSPPDDIPNASSDPSQKKVVILDAKGGWLVDLTKIPSSKPDWLNGKDLLKGLMWLRHLLQDPPRSEIQPVPTLRPFHEHMSPENEYAFHQYLYKTLEKVSRFRPRNSHVRFTETFSNPNFRSSFLTGLTPAIIYLIEYAPLLNSPEERFGLLHRLSKNIAGGYSDLIVGINTFIERIEIKRHPELDVRLKSHRNIIGGKVAYASNLVFGSLQANLDCSHHPKDTPEIVLSP